MNPVDGNRNFAARGNSGRRGTPCSLRTVEDAERLAHDASGAPRTRWSWAPIHRTRDGGEPRRRPASPSDRGRSGPPGAHALDPGAAVLVEAELLANGVDVVRTGRGDGRSWTARCHLADGRQLPPIWSVGSIGVRPDTRPPVDGRPGRGPRGRHRRRRRGPDQPSRDVTRLGGRCGEGRLGQRRRLDRGLANVANRQGRRVAGPHRRSRARAAPCRRPGRPSSRSSDARPPSTGWTEARLRPPGRPYRCHPLHPWTTTPPSTGSRADGAQACSTRSTGTILGAPGRGWSGRGQAHRRPGHGMSAACRAPDLADLELA